ncbi:MAG: hypothetical protein KatS3mg042_0562 [Rhodothermaceae bacterium]|nr:MAG: hypothetical protein KatS3mg042_0562 [Rhodothermaceae bacterium]
MNNQTNTKRTTRSDTPPDTVVTSKRLPYEPPAITTSGTLSVHAGSINLWLKP